jgi:hypothetical protein
MEIDEDEISSELESLICDLGERIDNAAKRLERATYRHPEGWEDDALDVIIGLQIYLKQLLEYVEWLTDGKWVDLSFAYIDADP